MQETSCSYFGHEVFSGIKVRDEKECTVDFELLCKAEPALLALPKRKSQQPFENPGHARLSGDTVGQLTGNGTPISSLSSQGPAL